MSTQSDTAIWCCSQCGNVVKLPSLTYYTVSRWCDHWHTKEFPEGVLRVRMAAVNDLAKAFDNAEQESDRESATKHERLREITSERADWRFGFV